MLISLSSLPALYKIELEACFHYFITTNMPCESKRKRLIESYGYEKTIEIMNTQNHCDGSISDKIIAETKNYYFYTCPCYFFNNDFSLLMELVVQKEKGNLPWNGGVLEQSAWIWEAINILNDLTETHKNMLEKKEQQKAKLKRKKYDKK